jgi:D-cysteine desulfhydrase
MTAAAAAARPCRASSAAAVDRLLAARQWFLASPAAELTPVETAAGARFRVLRDDLTHPFINGNKRRKLDGLWPELAARATDVVALGGAQSALLLAVAAAAAEGGSSVRAHLLVRGEPPAVPTGNLLFAQMLAHRTHFVPRREFADRVAALAAGVARAAAAAGPGAAVAALPEGAAAPAALLGFVRLVRWLADPAGGGVPAAAPAALIIDSGTCASAAGLALGAALLDLPWTVTGVAVADAGAAQAAAAAALAADFCAAYSVADAAGAAASAAARLAFPPRAAPRKFGSILPGEIALCARLAARHGVLLDPVWTLAAWEAAEAAALADPARPVVMVHSGGALGLAAAAQRWPGEFADV